MERRSIFLPLFLVFLVACSQGGFPEPIASSISKPQTTYAPPIPTRTRVGNYDVFDGVSQISELVLDIDGPQATAALSGKMEIRPIGGTAAPILVPLHVKGTINPETYAAHLWPTNPVELEALKMKVGVKLMCLQDDCTESFLDIYVKYKGRIYHHQVKSEVKRDLFDAGTGQTIQPVPRKKTKTSQNSGTDKVSDTSKPSYSTPSKPAKSSEASESSEARESSEDPSFSEFLGEMTPEDMESEHDLDHDEQMGAYVGEPEKDIEVFFPEEPKNSFLNSDERKEVMAGQTADSKKDETKKDPSDVLVIPLPKQDPPSSKDQTEREPPAPSLGRKLLNSLSQAIGPTDNGRLQNAVDIYKYQLETEAPGFRILYPKRGAHFGTSDMLYSIVRIGKFSLQKVNGYTISVGDISRKNGGKLGRHASHQRGIDADISYYFDNPKMQKGFINVLASSAHKRSWMAEKQWELFKSLVATNIVDRIFIDGKMKKELCEIASRAGEIKSGSAWGVPFEALRILRHAGGHANHFHLRLKCTKSQPRCRQMEAPKKATGC